MLNINEFKHYQINHSKQFTKLHNHINVIEDFWNQTKRHIKNLTVFLKKILSYFKSNVSGNLISHSYKEQAS